VTHPITVTCQRLNDLLDFTAISPAWCFQVSWLLITVHYIASSWLEQTCLIAINSSWWMSDRSFSRSNRFSPRAFSNSISSSHFFRVAARWLWHQPNQYASHVDNMKEPSFNDTAATVVTRCMYSRLNLLFLITATLICSILIQLKSFSTDLPSSKYLYLS